jgi:hypothetical protein
MERFSSTEYCSVYYVTLFERTVCGNLCWCTESQYIYIYIFDLMMEVLISETCSRFK